MRDKFVSIIFSAFLLMFYFVKKRIVVYYEQVEDYGTIKLKLGILITLYPRNQWPHGPSAAQG